MKHTIFAIVILLAASSCGNNSNKDNTDVSDTTAIPPATDSSLMDTGMNHSRGSDTMHMDTMLKKKDSVAKMNSK